MVKFPESRPEHAASGVEDTAAVWVDEIIVYVDMPDVPETVWKVVSPEVEFQFIVTEDGNGELLAADSVATALVGIVGTTIDVPMDKSVVVVVATGVPSEVEIDAEEDRVLEVAAFCVGPPYEFVQDSTILLIVAITIEPTCRLSTASPEGTLKGVAVKLNGEEPIFHVRDRRFFGSSSLYVLYELLEVVPSRETGWIGFGGRDVEAGDVTLALGINAEELELVLLDESNEEADDCVELVLLD